MTQQQAGKMMTENLVEDYTNVRGTTLDLFRPLKIEDAVIQSDAFGSPPNWHLAHVTWFFHKVLEKHGRKLKEEEDNSTADSINLAYLNSYYQRYGNILPKPMRGKFPRPTVDQTLKYRSMIDKEVISFLKEQKKEKDKLSDEISYDITLGIQHEMQHQELMIYDFQHYFQRFPDPQDNYKPVKIRIHQPAVKGEKPTGMVQVPGGIYELGFNGKGFCYDNELPEHKVYRQKQTKDQLFQRTYCMPRSPKV
jgi:hypothetical protein